MHWLKFCHNCVTVESCHKINILKHVRDTVTGKALFLNHKVKETGGLISVIPHFL